MDSTLQVQAGQKGDRVRTSLKTVLTENGTVEAHEEYVVPDLSYSVQGSYFFTTSFVGLAGTDQGGILAALIRPSSGLDVVLRSVTLGWFNEGVSSSNRVKMTRATASNIPGSTVGGSSIGKRIRATLTPRLLFRQNRPGLR